MVFEIQLQPRNPPQRQVAVLHVCDELAETICGEAGEKQDK
jgi:hypothetical protein